MPIGPFSSFSFPGVSTQTLLAPPLATAAGNLRIPAFVGVGDSEVLISNYEMIRGSSSLADNKIINQDVSAQFNGTNRDFTTAYQPLVSGNGSGTVTNNTAAVSVTIKGNPVAVASIDGTNGVINLIDIPSNGDLALASYYFKNRDDHHVNEDLSDQINGITTTFRTHFYPIVQGDNGGIPTIDPSKVIVKINNVPITVLSVIGTQGLFTIDTTAQIGQTLTVTYFSNEFQYTADILPSNNVSSLVSVGYAPGTSDFVNGIDFVLDTTTGTNSSFSTIQWGYSFKITAGQHTIATNYFDSDQITGTLFDNQILRRIATGLVDGTNATFALEAPPVNGQGRGVITEDTNIHVQAYVGTSPYDASQVDIDQIITVGGQKNIVLQTAPPEDSTVFVTQYQTLLPQDTWTLTNLLAGITGTGTYAIDGSNSGVAMNVAWSAPDTTVADPSFGTENVTYPGPTTGAANSDAQVIPSYAVPETVMLTFADATTYTVSSTAFNGSGSGNDNTGYLNQTYIDKVTGFRISILKGATVDYTNGDKLGYIVSPTIVTSNVPTRAIPGIKVQVNNTTGVGVSDTANIATYNRSGKEPNVGDFYYVTFYETKNFDSNGLMTPKVYTTEKDALNDIGVLSINNKLGIAIHLAFLNGASALAVLQIQQDPNSTDASDAKYIEAIDYFNEPLPGDIRPVIMMPVTTSAGVIEYLSTSNSIQSGIRYANERYSYFGFSVGTTPTVAQVFAKALNNMRMIAIYPDGATLNLPDSFGNSVEYLVDGSLLAAAVTGRDVSPQFDVAEPMTKKPIVGFNNLYRRLDSVTAAQTANSGITLLEELAAGIDIKFALTTDLSSVLTRTPSVLRTQDFVQRGTRTLLSPYIGKKNLAQNISQIEQSLRSYLSALQQANIISAFTGVKATEDPNDPTIINVVAYYSPVLPLLWIVVTFNLQSSI